MKAPHPDRWYGRPFALLSLALLAQGLAFEAWGQAVSTTQRAQQRGQAMMQSMHRNSAISTGGTSQMGATQAAMARSQAMMQSMNINQAARLRGLQQQVIYRTPDNLQGVYWNMHFANRARLRSTYGATLHLDTPLNDFLRYRLYLEEVADAQRSRAILSARSEELRRRQDLRNPQRDPNGPVPDYTPAFPGADMIGK